VRDVKSPGPATLVATGCGTAIACVCAVGLLQIERHLGGLWSVAAVLVAALLCAALARALGRLGAVVPSGVGLLAYLSRGLGRRRAMWLMLPYVALVLALVAVEARIVGAVVARLLPLPPLAGALAFLIGTWAVARAGVRPGLRAQAAATWTLMGGFALLAAAAIMHAARDPGFVARLLPAAPSALAFAGGVGQALFLFMGFELVTTQTELVRAPGAIATALRRSVVVLAIVLTVALHGQVLVALVLGAAAASAALVWAAALAVRERAPFAEPGRPAHHRWLALALAALFVAFGAGAVIESLPHPQPRGVIAHVR
jgi:amino acid transporter